MSQISIEARGRQAGGKNVNRRIRKAGSIPAVIYGPGKESIPLLVNPGDLTRIMHSDSGQNTIFIVNVDGSPHANAMIKDYQLDPVKGNLIHIDFQAVSLTEKIRANVGIQVTGNSPAVKDFNAVLVNGLTELEVESFPQDLPERVVIDISTLIKIGDGLYVRDIVLSDKVEVLSGPEEMIILATAPKIEVEEVVTPEEAVVEEAAEPEVIEKGKKEEEEDEKK